MPSVPRRLPLLAIAITVLLAVPGRAEGIDPAELAFWQSIESSTDPAEYRAYLDAFPEGRFAPLARLRANGGTTAATAAPRPAAAPDRDEIAFWASIENSKSAAEFQAYLDAYPHGRFVALARLRIAGLGADAVSPAEHAGPVALETEDASAPAIAFAEDIAGLADDGAVRGVLPVIGKGALQNLADLNRLRAVDLAIVQADLLDAAKSQDRDAGAITYIAKLYNEELHLLARHDIKSLAELAHQKLGVGARGGGAAVTAGRLFQLLKIPVEPENDDPSAALAKLRQGEIAALAIVAPKPAELFRGLDGKDGLHFLSVPINPAVTGAFVPTRLGAADYPGLVAPNQPVDAVAVGAVLAVASLAPGSPRYDAVARFADRFFTEFDTLLGPAHHPKWREVNLATDLPGWRRFPPAAQWLRRNQGVGAISPGALQAVFTRFIDERQQAAGGPLVPPQQKDDLFKEFQRWQSSQLR